MPGYKYAPRVLQGWADLPRSTAKAEEARHWEEQATYWKHRAESAERRMLEHDCSEEK